MVPADEIESGESGSTPNATEDEHSKVDDKDDQQQDNVLDTSECSICLLHVSDRSYLEPCRHEFDKQCILEWAASHNTCPGQLKPYPTHFHSSWLVCRVVATHVVYISSDDEFCEQTIPPTSHEAVELEDDDVARIVSLINNWRL